MRTLLRALKRLITGIWDTISWCVHEVGDVFHLLLGARGGEGSSPAAAQAAEESRVAAEASRDQYKTELGHDLRALRKLLVCQLNGRPMDDAAVERLSPHVVFAVKQMSPAQCEKLLASPAVEQIKLARSTYPHSTPEPDEAVIQAARREQLKDRAREAMRAKPKASNDVDAILRAMGHTG